jgi:hypothetical protein
LRYKFKDRTFNLCAPAPNIVLGEVNEENIFAS